MLSEGQYLRAAKELWRKMNVRPVWEMTWEEACQAYPEATAPAGEVDRSRSRYRASLEQGSSDYRIAHQKGRRWLR